MYGSTSHGDDYVGDFVCRLSDVFILDELQENFFQGRCADALADFAGCDVGDD